MIEVKVCNFSQNQITDLREMHKLCEELGWEPPQEYLDEWVKTVLGISRTAHVVGYYPLFRL